MPTMLPIVNIKVGTVKKESISAFFVINKSVSNWTYWSRTSLARDKTKKHPSQFLTELKTYHPYYFHQNPYMLEEF